MQESSPRPCDAARRHGVGHLAEMNNECPVRTMVYGVGDWVSADFLARRGKGKPVALLVFVTERSSATQ
jgi:hypothetical protein